MSVKEIFDSRNAFSFEVFPPRPMWAWRSCAVRVAYWSNCTP